MAKRRPSGDGMVRKREDGRWEGRIVVGHKDNGDSIFHYRRGVLQQGVLTQLAKDVRSPAGLRRLGTATRISVSLSRRLSAFFGSTSDQGPKAAKFAVLTPDRAGFPKRVKRSEGSDTTPI